MPTGIQEQWKWFHHYIWITDEQSLTSF